MWTDAGANVKQRALGQTEPGRAKVSQSQQRGFREGCGPDPIKDPGQLAIWEDAAQSRP